MDITEAATSCFLLLLILQENSRAEINQCQNSNAGDQQACKEILKAALEFGIDESPSKPAPAQTDQQISRQEKQGKVSQVACEMRQQRQQEKRNQFEKPANGKWPATGDTRRFGHGMPKTIAFQHFPD
ncbi:MAG: hypothetical protein DIKNOCCD_01748 [bacterium]|nr:hypothetical protein [bacterium]